jgi:hypothetical protein
LLCKKLTFFVCFVNLFRYYYLADDTKKLSQQENEIRQYANDLYRQKKITQQQSDKIAKQSHAFQNLSKINDELCIKVNQLAHLQNADKRLEEKTQEYNVLAGEFHALQSNHSNVNNRFEEMKQLIDSLESERNEAQKENKALSERLKELNVNFVKKCEESNELLKLKDEKERHTEEIQENSR